MDFSVKTILFPSKGRNKRGRTTASGGSSSGGVSTLRRHGELEEVSMIGEETYDDAIHLDEEAANKLEGLHNSTVTGSANINVTVTTDALGDKTFEVATKDDYLSKAKEDTAAEIITFAKGIVSTIQSWFKKGLWIGSSKQYGVTEEGVATLDEVVSTGYDAGAMSGGYRLWKDLVNGDGCLNLDRLVVKKEAIFNILTTREMRAVGGIVVVSPADAKIKSVTEYANTWKCNYEDKYGQVWRVGDQARCQRPMAGGTKYYWRVVTAVSSTPNAAGEHWFELSKTLTSGSGVPEVGDEVVLFGYQGSDEPYRRNLIVLSSGSMEQATPSLVFYQGVVNFGALQSKERINISDKVKFIVDEFSILAGGGTTSYPAARECGAWTSGTRAYKNDRYSYQGAIWICITTNTAGITTAPSGSDGNWFKQTSTDGDILLQASNELTLVVDSLVDDLAATGINISTGLITLKGDTKIIDSGGNPVAMFAGGKIKGSVIDATTINTAQLNTATLVVTDGAKIGNFVVSGGILSNASGNARVSITNAALTNNIEIGYETPSFDFGYLTVRSDRALKIVGGQADANSYAAKIEGGILLHAKGVTYDSNNGIGGLIVRGTLVIDSSYYTNIRFENISRLTNQSSTYSGWLFVDPGNGALYLRQKNGNF